jgi:CHASE2 domain-containing sensor protein
MPAAQHADSPDALFDQSQYKIMRLHRRKMNDLLRTLEKAQACGIACDFIRQQRDEVEQQLAAIEQHFMTPPPAK